MDFNGNSQVQCQVQPSSAQRASTELAKLVARSTKKVMLGTSSLSSTATAKKKKPEAISTAQRQQVIDLIERAIQVAEEDDD